MQVNTVKVDITTDASGDFTQQIKVGGGMLGKIFYEAGTLATGTNISIVDKVTGETIFAALAVGTSNFTSYPRRLEQLNTDNTDLTTHDLIMMTAPELTISAGGNALSGSITLFVAN